MMLFVFAILVALANPSYGLSEEQLKEFIENGWDFCIGDNIKDILNNWGYGAKKYFFYLESFVVL